MKSGGLFDPTERMSVTGFLRHRFGTDECPQGYQNVWTVELLDQIFRSFLFFCSNFVYIADKGDTAVLLQPFAGQAIHTLCIEAQRKAGLPVRVVEVKARQVGFTTINIARMLHYCLDENKRGLLLVDDEDVAAEQATRLNTMLNGLPAFMQPMRRIQNLKHLVFDNPNPKDRLENPGLNAALQITVPTSFRGAPPGFVCVSEYAHMHPDRQHAVQIGIVSAMALRPEKMLIIDTTPNSFDDHYYPMVKDAIKRSPKWVKRIENWKGELSAQEVLDGALGVPEAIERGRPGMVPSLCPWRIHEEFSCKSPQTPRGELPPLKKALRDEIVSDLGQYERYGGEEEIEMRDRYEVSIDRLFWRRVKIDSYDYPTEEMRLLSFRQEHLSTIESAFIDSGKAPFDRASLDALMRMEKAPAARGLFRGEGEFDPRANNQWHEWRIYAPPQNGEKYTMGVDCDQAYESPDSDATVAQIVRWRDNKVVATYEARVPAYLLRQQLYYAYRWYLNCYYAIETAGMGYDLTRSCMEMGMNNVYYWKRHDMAPHEQEPSKYPGWQTDAKTRPLMDQTFTELLCARNRETGKPEPEIIIPDEKTLHEIRGLTRQPTGAFKSNSGHDDHYDALCIALCIARDPFSGMHRQKVREEQKRREDFEREFSMINKVRGPKFDLANI